MNTESIQEHLNTLSRYCAYQERCVQEVKQKMFEIGVLPEEQKILLQHLMKEGFLDEERYATAYVRGKFRINQWGKNKIKAGLIQKGVTADNIRIALNTLDPTEYTALAQSLAEKQLPKIKAKTDYERQQKLRFYLSQKGFESEVIINVINVIM
jgi:regulatory protein